MKKRLFFALLALAFGVLGCTETSNTPKVSYTDLYDPIQDNGQYTHPAISIKPESYWSCTGVIGAAGSRLGLNEKTEGLQYQLMCQSLSGLVNRAVQEGKSKTGIWFEDTEGSEAYKLSKEALKEMGIKELGKKNGIELAKELKALFDGYVLTDVERNPESSIVASVAAHVYNAIIVDVRDKKEFEAAGFKMKYDATKKTTADSWKEFKDKCRNNALVIMAVQTSGLRDFAIANNLFVVNVNKQFQDMNGGQNVELLKEVLAWLKPNAAVYGWEPKSGGEERFVNPGSICGNPTICCAGSFNFPMTSLMYQSRQKSVLAKVINPKEIDYRKQSKKFVSFLLTDGDNVSWMTNGFCNEDYYLHPKASELKMGFGIGGSTLDMIVPSQFENILNKQDTNSTLVETFGGGYYYCDNYGDGKQRGTTLKVMAKNVAAHMRQHRIKILEQMARYDVKSDASKAAYQAFIDANDQLEGIVAVQYNPYADGKGDILWFTNSKGYDIPVIMVKYSIWNFGDKNNPSQGSPTYIAHKLNAEISNSPFSIVINHVWSRFKDTGNSNDELAENTDGNIKGTGAIDLCARRINKDIKVVPLQELVWRVRMQYREKQTKKFLGELN